MVPPLETGRGALKAKRNAQTPHYLLFHLFENPLLALIHPSIHKLTFFSQCLNNYLNLQQWVSFQEHQLCSGGAILIEVTSGYQMLGRSGLNWFGSSLFSPTGGWWWEEGWGTAREGVWLRCLCKPAAAAQQEFSNQVRASYSALSLQKRESVICGWRGGGKQKRNLYPL